MNAIDGDRIATKHNLSFFWDYFSFNWRLEHNEAPNVVYRLFARYEFKATINNIDFEDMCLFLVKKYNLVSKL